MTSLNGFHNFARRSSIVQGKSDTSRGTVAGTYNRRLLNWTHTAIGQRDVYPSLLFPCGFQTQTPLL